ncbi:sensor histidine kinase [Zwartia sp.]|uniref:sensor histidine kinase n=1 Tax=Zwartia sp. TaxID=2978004 RepID=UPI003BB18CCC
MNVSLQRVNKTLSLFAVMLACCVFAQAVRAFVLDRDTASVNLIPYVEVLTDPTGKLTLQEILTHPDQYPFSTKTDPSARELSFGFSDAAHWIRVDLSRQPEASSRWVLEVPYVAIDDLQWYPPSGQKAVSGTTRYLLDRQIITRSHAFYVDVDQESKTYYLRVQSSYPLTLPMQLMRTDIFGREQLIDTMVQSLYYGGLLSLFLYNLIIYFTSRDRRYLLYCMFAVSVAMAMYAGNGYGRLFIWPAHPLFDRISQGFFIGLATGFAFLFSCTFLQLKQRIPTVYWILLIATIVSLAVSCGLLLSMFIQMSLGWLYMLQFSTSSLGMVACVSVAIHLSTKGVREANYFIVSWGFLCIGAITGSLRAFELLPNNLFTMYAVQISSGFEALFFSFALADRLRSEGQGKELAQRQLFASQQETVQALQISEERLAAAVDIRTQELRAVVVKEQQVREQYVRFGAMIAHEFRNPLNVIETQNALFEMEPDAGREKVKKRVGVIRSAVTRLSEMFDQWLQSDRLNQAFANITPLPIDARGLLEDAIVASRSYHSDFVVLSDLPDAAVVIRADYALLRIAILNLIDNACKYSARGGEIRIGASVDQEWLRMYVSDSGTGIPLDKQKTIFEPYVRLASAERLVGVGLGLSFVKRIVDLHEGRLEVISHLGVGSTFTILIKLDQDA